MTTDYTHQDFKLTFLFPEKIEASPFSLSEYNRVTTSGYRRDSVTKGIRLSDKFFVLTLQDEPSAADLNQALHKAISDKALVQLSLTHNGSAIHDLNVVVSESATEKPNNYRLSVVKA
ncbi:hypothetical protein [Aeromonas veronii]|uniref:hypothetical protein n=1 Tax=Aeromonas TaxID=642 RepID=UPI002444A6BE|nr:hypothetical protein [Aeromonas veronii]